MVSIKRMFDRSVNRLCYSIYIFTFHLYIAHRKPIVLLVLLIISTFIYGLHL